METAGHTVNEIVPIGRIGCRLHGITYGCSISRSPLIGGLMEGQAWFDDDRNAPNRGHAEGNNGGKGNQDR